MNKTKYHQTKSIYSGIKFIDAETLVNSIFKENLIYDIFSQGYRSESFVLIIDSVEKIIEYSKLGNVYNNKILQMIYMMMSKIVDSHKSIVVILTSSNRQLMTNLDFNTICNYTYSLFDTSTSKTNDKMASDYFKEKKFIN